MTEPTHPGNWKQLLSRKGILFLGLSLLPAIFVLLAVLLPSKNTLLAWDQHLSFWILLLNLIVIVAGLVYYGKDLTSWLREHLPGSRILLLLFAFLALSTWLTGDLIEARHRVQSDESTYLQIAQNMYYNQMSSGCNQGFFENGKLDCLNQNTSFKAKGQSVVYLLGMPFLGSELNWIFNVQLLLYFLTGLFFFLAVQVWTQSPFTAMAATAWLMMTPTVMFQFRSTSVEPLYIFLSAVSLVFMKWVHDRPENPLRWVLFAAVLAFFAQTRQETVFCLFAFAVFSLLPMLKHRWSMTAFSASLSLLSMPILITISYYRGYGFQGGKFEAHGHFWENVATNWKLLAKTPMKGELLANPFLSSLAWMAAFGLGVLILRALFSKKYRLWAGFFLLYHLQSFMIFENVSGDFTIEINQRYSLVIFPTLAFFAGLLLREVFTGAVPTFMGTKVNEKKQQFAVVILAGLVTAAALLGTYRHKKSLEANIMYKRNHLTTEEVAIHDWLDKNPGRSKLFVYHRPGLFTGYGWSAMNYNRFRGLSDSKRKKLRQRFTGGIFYVRGLDCWDSKTYHAKAVEHRVPSACNLFEQSFQLQQVFQKSITGSYRLKISRVLAKGENQQAFRFEKFDFISERTAVLRYRMNVPGSLQLSINGKNIPVKPSRIGLQSDTLQNLSLQPGYNSLKLTAARQSETYWQFLFPQQAKKLSELQIKSQTQSWGDLGIRHSVGGTALTINGEVYPDGLGTHASSRIEYALDGKFSTFSTLYGLDDAAVGGGDGVRFRILGDGRLLHQSPIMAALKTGKAQVDISGVRTLVLEVDSLGNKDFDHADWLLPFLFNPSSESQNSESKEHVVPLSSLHPEQYRQSWGALQTNLAQSGTALSVSGRRYASGLGTHASSRIEYKLDGQYRLLKTAYGQDDGAQGGDGMVFRILGDGRLLHQSKTMEQGRTGRCEVKVQGVRVLVLEVDSLGNKDFDHADWLEPVLYR